MSNVKLSELGTRPVPLLRRRSKAVSVKLNRHVGSKGMLPGWPRLFLRSLSQPGHVPPLLLSEMLTRRAVQASNQAPPSAPFNINNNIRNVLRQIRHVRSVQSLAINKRNHEPRTTVPHAKVVDAVDRRRSLRSHPRAASANPLTISLGGRGLVNQNRLLSMGITPMLLHQQSTVDGMITLEDREAFIAEVRNSILLELRDLLEESR